MNSLGKILWIATKGVFLLIGLGAVLGGGICGVMLVVPAATRMSSPPVTA